MKLKYYLVFTAFALSSCGEGFFEQYPSNDITEGNFYKTDDDFNQGVVSCYAKLKTMMSFHLTEIGYRSDENILESMAVSTQDRYDIDNFIETASNGILSDIWDAWYNGIYRCNDVLDHMNGVQIPNYNKYRGECLFMRSWWYFNLYRTFGVVPIARTVVPPAAAKLIPRCTEEEMYSLLTEDLAEAARLLPDTRNAEKARVTGIAAYTLLAKVYLTFGKHAEARTALDEAMKATGYGLESTTKRVFDINNKMNKEVIFALYYNKTNEEGMYLHFKTVADAVHIPCILYNVPGRTGCSISENVVRRLSVHPNIVGIKEASGSLSYATKIARYLSDDFLMYSGNDDIVLPMMALGSSGVISVAANILPREIHDMVWNYLRGDRAAALETQLRYLDVINGLFLEVNPVPVKEALNLMGMEVGGYRLPLTTMSEGPRAALREAMEKAGVLA